MSVMCDLAFLVSFAFTCFVLDSKASCNHFGEFFSLLVFRELITLCLISWVLLHIVCM